MIFGRNRNVKTETVVLPEELQDPRDQAGTDPVAEATGPYDIAERPEAEGYLDLGSLRVPMVKDLKVRLDLEDSTKRIIGVTLQLGQSSVQAQAFAAPRSGGLWDEIRAEILESVTATEGAQVGEQEGPFGTEVAARIPAAMPDGSPGWRVARFVGVDGPRWFLRGVVGGEAAFKDEAAGALNDVFSRIVVRRGDDPHPPRELLPLTPPENMRPVPQNSPPGRSTPAPERGPEITEVR
ncbi:DUF3710 domain-containing protein [Citricoccus sp. I39-566]|uniref:DUF3710 domain-containing protein n=1 Tax=Citricoccus sp. I39-566 TaxID=3073268 RepID=UPI00286CE7A3|nr:DUF3710 domain-containing protein [Citricoccus sp. I39-566]WMY77573.1 DUF3710 domain-containing protein [Citricoccus sp. I39-566]